MEHNGASSSVLEGGGGGGGGGGGNSSSSSDVSSIDVEVFGKRVGALFEYVWGNKSYEGECDALMFVMGKVDEEERLSRSNKMHLWLFGLIFTETLIILSKKREMLFFTRTKKLSYFQTLAKKMGTSGDTILKWHLIERKNNTTEDLIELLKTDVMKVVNDWRTKDEGLFRIGVFSDKSELPRSGLFANTTESFLKTNIPSADDTGKPVATENLELRLQYIPIELVQPLTIHDDAALADERKAGSLATRVLKEVLLTRVVELMETEGSQTHAEIAGLVETAFSDKAKLTRWKVKYGLNPDLISVAKALVQSSSSGFELNEDAESSDDKLNVSQGSIIVSLIAKYNSYYAIIGRTLLLDPNKAELEFYKQAIVIFDYVVETIRPGVKFREVYEKTLAKAEQVSPTLAKAMSKILGYALGLSFSEPGFCIRLKTDALIEARMVIAVRLGFHPLDVGRANQPLAIWLCDTINVTENGPNEFLTNCTRKVDDIVYELEEKPQTTTATPAAADLEPPPKKSKEHGKPKKENVGKSQPKMSESGGSGKHHQAQPTTRMSTRITLRRREAQVSHAEMEKLMMKQRELRKRKLEELSQRFKAGGDFAENKKAVTKLAQMHAYRDTVEFPKELKPKKIYVDLLREAVLLPVGKGHVPFHVSTIRTVTHQEEDAGHHTLRIGFQVPGAQSLVKSTTEPSPLPDLSDKENSLFIKELIYKSQDAGLVNVAKNIREAMKRNKLREAGGDGGGENGAPQVPIQLNRTPGGKHVFLRQLMVRHQAGFSRRIIGTLEAHINGFRYTAPKYEIVDIIYSNIRHAFFQPVTNELMVVLHFVFKTPLTFNKKKVKEIQFYTETGSQAQDLDARRSRSMMDPDEMFEEQREREMKRRLNTEFRRFVEQAQEISNVKFEVPVRSLAFSGVPRNTDVVLMPTANCLVQLAEWPAFVLSLSDVEIVSLERIVQGLRHFDIVFIPKDYTKPTTQITTVPTEALTQVKSWLNEMDIVWYEGKSNLNWPRILKTIREDVSGFVEQGGFGYFMGDDTDEKKKRHKPKNGETNSSDSEDGGGSSNGSDATDEDDEYQTSSSSDSGSEESEESSENSDSEGGGGGSSDSDDEDAGSDAEDADEGLSWDELDRRAAESDRKRGHGGSDSEEEERARKKKKRS